LVRRLGLDDELVGNQSDPATWPDDRARLAAVFKTKTRDEWCALLEGTETCFAPVLGLAEAPEHAHNVERGTFVEVDGVVQPGAAPRFSRTPAGVPGSLDRAGEHTIDVLLDAGFSRAEVDALLDARIVGQAQNPTDFT
jgi:alpha-methylacyl-CoA racemase